jgi:hypothetical protein
MIYPLILAHLYIEIFHILLEQGLCCPVKVEALRLTDPSSKDSYHLPKRDLEYLYIVFELQERDMYFKVLKLLMPF